jgi:hypothetical protein
MSMVILKGDVLNISIQNVIFAYILWIPKMFLLKYKRNSMKINNIQMKTFHWYELTKQMSYSSQNHDKHLFLSFVKVQINFSIIISILKNLVVHLTYQKRSLLINQIWNVYKQLLQAKKREFHKRHLIYNDVPQNLHFGYIVKTTFCWCWIWFPNLQ